MSKRATRRAPDWEIYERLVARMLAQQSETDLCVTPNAHIVGRISGVRRQIDVLIEARHDTDNSRRIIVDAKRRSRKVDVKEVERFRGLMEDVGATHGYLVSPVGYTKAAEKRAQSAVSIRIVTLDRLEGLRSFDLATMPKERLRTRSYILGWISGAFRIAPSCRWVGTDYRLVPALCREVRSLRKVPCLVPCL